MHLRVVLLVLGAALVAPSCFVGIDDLQDQEPTDAGTDSGSDADANGGMPLSSFPAAFAKAHCARLARCLGPMAEFAVGSNCTGYLSKVLAQATLAGVEGLPVSRFEYHPEAAAACLTATENAACDVPYPFAKECDAALEGKVKEGGECKHAMECVRGSYCDAKPSACPGTCKLRVDIGASCESAVCLEGLNCSRSGGNSTCVAPLPKGAACTEGSSTGCRIDLFCINKGFGATGPGVCHANAELFTTGESLPCDWVKGPLCQSGLACKLAASLPATGSGTCASPVAAGAPCRLALPDMCPAEHYCKIDSSLDGTCEPLPKELEPCVAIAYKALCADGNRCTERGTDPAVQPGICRGIAGLTDACTENGLCYSGYCLGGQCAIPGYCAG